MLSCPSNSSSLTTSLFINLNWMHSWVFLGLKRFSCALSLRAFTLFSKKAKIVKCAFFLLWCFCALLSVSDYSSSVENSDNCSAFFLDCSAQNFLLEKNCLLWDYIDSIDSSFSVLFDCGCWGNSIFWAFSRYLDSEGESEIS